MSVQYVVDNKGKKTGVFLSLDEYQEMLEKIEDIEALALINAKLEEGLDLIPFKEFVSDL